MGIDVFLQIFVFLLGLCIGSFLNCAIYRAEEEKTLQGRSFCPHCKHTLGWMDLVPVFSFMLLRGKCRYCSKKISWQYPIVELATGIVFLMVYYFLGQGALSSVWQFLSLVFWLYESAVLVFIFVFDLKHSLIPRNPLIWAIAIGVAYQMVANWQNLQAFSGCLLAVVIGAGFFWLMWWISNEKWMGYGDVELAVLMGFLVGFPGILVALFTAFFLGSIVGLVLISLEKKGLKSPMPFGPFLILGTFLALFFGNQIIQWYLSLLTIK